MNTDDVWKRIIKYLSSEKRRILLLSICLCVSSLIVFLQPLVIRSITDKGMVQKDFTHILKFSIFLFTIVLFGHLLEFLKIKLFADIGNSVNYKIYQEVIEKIIVMPIAYFKEKNSTEIAGTLDKDIDTIGGILNQYVAFSVSGILQMIGGIGGLFLLEFRLTLLILILIPIKFIISEVISHNKDRLMKNLISSESVFLGWLGEQIEGIEEIKLWNLREKILVQLGVNRKNIMQLIKDNALLDQKRIFCDSLVDIFITSLLYIFSGYMIVKGDFTIGSAFAFITYSCYVTIPVSMVVSIRYALARVRPSAERLFSFLDKEEEKEGKTVALEPVSTGAVIEFTHVTFSYNTKKTCLRDISFCIRKGEKVALVGDNGAGKSTIFNLILGFYDPTEGEIKMWNHPISEINRIELREHISIVRQKPFLFSGSIGENIALLDDYTEDEIEKVAKQSGADKFVNKLSRRYQERVGQSGVKLSGGEQKKIAITRALLKNSEILLLDEVSAGCDKQTKRTLNQLINNELKEKTVLLITHDKEDLQYVDFVLRIKDGSIIREKSYID